MKKLLLMLVLLCTMANSTWADLTPRSGDTWDSTTKTLTVNSDLYDDLYQNCTEIVNLIIGSSVTSIGEAAFLGCTGLTTVIISYRDNTATNIGPGAFYGCTNLTTVNIDNNFSGNGFQSCNSITTLNIGTNVTSIGDQAFYYRTNLQTINFAEDSKLTTIGERAFQNCTGLTEINFPGSLTTIGSNAFYECSNLTTVTINHNSNNTETSIGEGVFGNTNLTTVNLNNNINGCLGDSKLTTVNIGSSVTSLGYHAFYYCTGLTTITIPANVTTIGQDAFKNCTGLNTVTIGSGVTRIENNAFIDCSNVTDVYCYADPTKLTWESPDNDFNSEANFHVVNASAWSSFDIISKVQGNLAPQAATNSANGAYWSTYYNTMAHMKADDNTTVYKAAIDGTNIVLTQISDKVITAGQAVVLRRNAEGAVTLTPQSTASTADYSDNQLRGTDVALAQEDGYTYYVLSKKSDNFGFFKLTPTTLLGANKAFLKVGANAAREFYGFDMDVTGVTNTKQTNFTNANSQYYDLQGRKVVKPEKGLYIVDGKKYVVK